MCKFLEQFLQFICIIEKNTVTLQKIFKAYEKYQICRLR